MANVSRAAVTCHDRLDAFLRGEPWPRAGWLNGAVWAPNAPEAREVDAVSGELVTDAVLAPTPILLTKVREPRPEEKTPIGGFNVVDPRGQGRSR